MSQWILPSNFQRNGSAEFIEKAIAKGSHHVIKVHCLELCDCGSDSMYFFSQDLECNLKC